MSLNNVLITGSTGFLGNFLLNYFKDNNIDVHELHKPNGFNSIRLNKEIPNFNFNFDLVIHAAGKAHVLSTNKIEESQFFDVNVNGTNNLLTGLENSCIPKYLVFISSVSVYGLDIGFDIDENYPLNASDPYGRSKIACERILLDWCVKNSVVCTILRLPLVVGENPPGYLGLMIEGIRNGYYFNVGGGKSRKSMILIDDVARFIFKNSEYGGTYNLTDGCHPSFFELSSLISRQLGKKPPFNIPYWCAKALAICGDNLGDIWPINTSRLNKISNDLIFNDSKARKSLNWKPSSVLENHFLFK